MPMNMIIREKRKEIGLTQEQIAEYLGVSTPAVNKWEKGATYPDISLLPALARLLKVDLNTLLCFNEGLSEQEISHFSKEVIDTIRKSGFESGFTMGIEKIQEYPNCGLLIHSTALLLDGALMMSGMSTDDKEKYNSQITALYERAAKCEDDQIRNKAIFMLTSKYMGQGKYDKAQEMLDLLPERTAMDKKQLQANLLIKQNKLPEAAKLLERKLLMEINEIQTILISLADIALKEGNNQDASHIAELSRYAARLFDLWDYYSFVAPLQIALAQENVQDSIALLKSILAAALTPWEMKKSSLYRHMAVNANHENFGVQMLPALLSEIENGPQYAFLHSNAEFQQLIKQYRAKC
ncbi:MAG: helix-turn-helix domain-containing protein [Ruminiclostridium sp.]